MKLSREQSERLLREHGICVTEACDRCGQLLGSARWTRKGEPGEWCSAACRDGISTPKPVATLRHDTVPRRIGARPEEQPRKHENNAQKCRAYRKRLKSASTTRNTPWEPTENAQLASAKNGSRGGHVVRETAAVVRAPIEKSQLSETSGHARSVEEAPVL
jgi:hypothetical protein